MTYNWSIALFAGLPERLGTSRIELTLDNETLSVGELKAALIAAYPEHSALLGICFAARNEAYAADADTVSCRDMIALLPPVSGGDGAGEPAAAAPPAYRIAHEPLDAAAVAALVEDDNHGAALVFIGTTREWTGGQRTVRLEYEAYEPMALRTMEQIGQELQERWPGTRCAIYHRIGVVAVGEASVVIAVSSGHRAASYEASRYAIERLKQIVPIWKKEIWEDGSEWKGHQLGPWNPLAEPSWPAAERPLTANAAADADGADVS
ncbi:molybdenum cofactor biosynthesis protein MoaE [Paenibacillus pasadenensis]|uniref:molybdenum cofactor biosynthesis protein n=1 Tax=Paenibacillus pasadenensis TaxID=217090 RepID=UPI00203E677A|nr:molybdenum cofactor biosynthesis protein MoaE [Paenibacillus pasadenensis]MCM3748013.1 molybdenum cofactor biosynthesis protein MoaE [Paenibacillus pasadenensis]